MPKRRTQRVKSPTASPVSTQSLKRSPPAVVAAAASGEAVVSLRRGLEILRTFQPDDGLLSRHEIAQRTGLPNTTTARLIYTLVTLGYLSRVGVHGGYRPGPSVLALGHALIEALPFRRVARPLMHRFALDFNVWVTLGTAEGGNILVLEHASSPRAPDIQIRPGSLLPMASTALGRAYLWAMTPEHRAEYLREIDGNRAAIGARLGRGVRTAISELDQGGFCTTSGTWRREILEVGTPIVLGNDDHVLALACGSTNLATNARVLAEEYGPALLRLATDIKNSLLKSGSLEDL
jgi:IclR family transcriptional regulator, positive regulator for flagellar biogenesis